MPSRSGASILQEDRGDEFIDGSQKIFLTPLNSIGIHTNSPRSSSPQKSQTSLQLRNIACQQIKKKVCNPHQGQPRTMSLELGGGLPAPNNTPWRYNSKNQMIRPRLELETFSDPNIDVRLT
jgi:hypothetical protein